MPKIELVRTPQQRSEMIENTIKLAANTLGGVDRDALLQVLIDRAGVTAQEASDVLAALVSRGEVVVR